MFDVQALDLPGVTLLRAPVHGDGRGSVTKLFHAEAFAALGLRGDFREQYHSRSHRDVLRGMHFQSPPHDHAKLVTVLAGRILDVVLDLRPGPDYGRSVAVDLSAGRGLALYVPEGCAHGFLTLADDTLTLYDVTSVHAPTHDFGIRWDGFGFRWPVERPILSDRDRRLPMLGEFDTPFAPPPSAVG